MKLQMTLRFESGGHRSRFDFAQWNERLLGYEPKTLLAMLQRRQRSESHDDAGEDEQGQGQQAIEDGRVTEDRLIGQELTVAPASISAALQRDTAVVGTEARTLMDQGMMSSSGRGPLSVVTGSQEVERAQTPERWALTDATPPREPMGRPQNLWTCATALV